jgi:pyridinium-3,5-bisthiocarboxylic acid mononucleotide nickel chelatase
VKVLYFDCFSGASGDMVLGALIDAGVPLAEVRRALGSLAIDPDAVWTESVVRTGIRATKFCVRGESGEHTHNHGHEPHRTLTEIGALIDGSALSAAGKTRAKGLFCRLGEVEAAIHGVTTDQVHLHEVGALDSIIDIVGSVFGMDWLAADRVVASPVNVGSGTVRCDHGVLPVPAPATARLLEGVPVYARGVPTELTTPTGALLVTAFAESFGPLPEMRVAQIGYGAGDKDFADYPNLLRFMVGESAAASALETIVALECEIDDMNPQLFGPLMDRLYAAGALDVFYAAVQMKKNRPGTLVTIVAPPDRREALAGILFAETTTIGVRHREMQRERLDRKVVIVDTSVGPIRFKVATRDGRVMNAAPEFDDCVKAAAGRGLSIKDVQARALKAWMDRKD